MESYPSEESEATQVARRDVLLLLFCYCELSFAYGAWFKTPEELKGSPVSWAILKHGIFSRAGKLKVVTSLKECPTQKPLFAWVTHRLSVGETLTKEAAKKLAAELNASLGDCYTGVEIDTEPLKTLSPWFLEFAKELRDNLNKKYRLHMAIPTVSSKPGADLTWSPAMAMILLTAVDGVDLMIYDTASATSTEYQNYLKEAFSFGVTAPAEKGVTFGLPAYPDKTKKHRPGIETLAHVETLLRKQRDLSKAFCGPQRRIAVYAGWTMTEDDKKTAAKTLLCPE